MVFCRHQYDHCRNHCHQYHDEQQYCNTTFIICKKFKARGDGLLTNRILNIRRFSILLIIALAYLYDKLVAQHFTLVSIGMVSFAAVAQLAPAIIGGIYWKQASQKERWPVFAQALSFGSLLQFAFNGWCRYCKHQHCWKGLFAFRGLSHFAFGMDGMDSVTLLLFLEFVFNIITFVTISLNTKESTGNLPGRNFVDIFKHSVTPMENTLWKARPISDLQALLGNFWEPKGRISYYRVMASAIKFPWM